MTCADRLKAPKRPIGDPDVMRVLSRTCVTRMQHDSSNFTMNEKNRCEVRTLAWLTDNFVSIVSQARYHGVELSERHACRSGI